jgi:hypothetical protein
MVVNSKFTFLNRTVSLLDGSFMYISIPLFSFLFFFFIFLFFLLDSPAGSNFILFWS